MRKNNGIKTGLHVTFTRAAAEFLAVDAGDRLDRLAIHEVTDSRHVGGGRYVYTLTPVQIPPALNARYIDVDPDDLEAVG
jgi:hypothetical protein